MKKSWKYVIGIIVGLLVSTAIVVPIVLYELGVFNRGGGGLKDHDPITIWGDGDFQVYDFEGTGTANDPYLIEYLNITTTTPYSIYIFATSSYFSIQHCYLSTSHDTGKTIYLENVAEGTANIHNNTITNCLRGAYLSNIDSANITNNEFIDCYFALTLTACDDNFVSNNKFHSLKGNARFGVRYPIIGTSAINANITENEFYGDHTTIQLDFCRSMYIAHNVMDNITLFLTYSQNSQIAQNDGDLLEIVLLYSRESNITHNSGDSLSTFQSPSSRLEQNSFLAYSISELSIENYESYVCVGNLAAEGGFSLIVSSATMDLGPTLSFNSQIILVNCSDVWLHSFTSSIYNTIYVNFIFCDDISIMHSIIESSMYFKESENIFFYNNSLIDFYSDKTNSVEIIGSNFGELDVYCTYSFDITFEDNYFYKSQLSLVESSDCFLSENVFYESHIDSYLNDNLTLSLNQFQYCEYGITDSNSDDLLILNNSFEPMMGSGPRFIWTERISFINNSISGPIAGFDLVSGFDALKDFIIVNNTVNYNPLGFFKDQTNLILDGVVFGQLIIYNCTNAQLTNISISETSTAILVHKSNNFNLHDSRIQFCENGVHIVQSASSTITNLETYNCTVVGLDIDSSNNVGIFDSLFSIALDGMVISSSDNFHLENNIFYQNNDALKIYYSSDSIIYNNTFLENSNRGILAVGTSQNINITNNWFEDNQGYAIELSTSSTGNRIHHNAFIDNNVGGSSQAMDRQGDSYWYDVSSNQGNYWNTWSGVGSYQIDTDETSVSDPYPLYSNPL